MRQLEVIRHEILLFILLAVLPVSLYSQRRYNILFYNLENLFDPSDSLRQDRSFTPGGNYHWTNTRLYSKLNRIYKTLFTACKGNFPDIVGFAEVENRDILEKFLRFTPMQKGNYRIIHKESPDPRGIDVALIYRADRITPVGYHHFTVNGSKSHPVRTREILLFSCLVANQNMEILINHWPSRSGGYLESKPKRENAATVCRSIVDSLLRRNANAMVLLLGDFNATPREKCITNILRAEKEGESLRPDRLINLSREWGNSGTIRNQGQWEIFDQIIYSQGTINNSILRIDKSESGIINLPHLLEKDHHFLGQKPRRTYLGPVYHGGTSDHLPVKISFLHDVN